MGYDPPQSRGRGRHTVQKVEIDVQLEEDLTDSLGGLKVGLLVSSSQRI